MGTFFVYILKTTFCLAGFYLFYRLRLVEKFFRRIHKQIDSHNIGNLAPSLCT